MNKGKQEGITLIALIITIIVMLILVAVTVRTAVNSGLFGHAQNAIKQWADAQKSESNIDGNIEEILKEVRKVTLYFERPEHWIGENVYAFVWNEKGECYAEWPGVVAELVEGTENIYKYEIPETFVGSNIIFNMGNSDIQTINLKMPNDGYIFRTTDDQSRKIFFPYNNNEEEQIYIYAWSNGGSSMTWPGVLMSVNYDIGAGPIREYTLPDNLDNFIFSNDKESHTADLIFKGRNRIYGWDGEIIGIRSYGVWEKYDGVK